MSLHYFLGFSTLKLPRKVKFKTIQNDFQIFISIFLFFQLGLPRQRCRSGV